MEVPLGESTRPQVRSAVTRSAIVDAARRRFDELGYDAVTVDLICAEAHISRGAFYYHFADRADVLVAVANAAGPRLQDAFEMALRSSATTDELLTITVKLFVGGVSSMRRTTAQVSVPEMVRRWCTGSEPPALRENLRAVLERADERGELPERWSPSTLASVLFGTLLAVVIEAVADGRRPLSELEASALSCVAPLLATT